jgi:hypothetical protein
MNPIVCTSLSSPDLIHTEDIRPNTGSSGCGLRVIIIIIIIIIAIVTI